MKCPYLKTGVCERYPDLGLLHVTITRMIKYHLELSGAAITEGQASNAAAQIVTALPELGRQKNAEVEE